MGTDMHYGATRKTFQFAAYLRKHMTPAEKFLWQHLRKSELGLRIRAQHPLSRYVVDFYCHEVRLVIEADGSIHTVEAVQLSDKEREEQLRFLGLHILRFDNDTIITNIKSVSL
jgi:cyclase